MGEEVRFWYFVLNVYRFFDLCCDLYCCYHFQNPEQKDKMMAACLLATVFNIYSLCRAMLICSDREIKLTELNFNVIEVIVNVFQTDIGVKGLYSLTDKTCIDSMSFGFACCSSFGSVLHIFCFLKNICGGERKQSDFRKIINTLGLFGSLYSANIGFMPIYDTFGTGSC